MLVYKVTTVYITGNAFLWTVEGRIPVLKKSWLFPWECIAKHRCANSVPCGNRLCFLTHRIHTCSWPSSENYPDSSSTFSLLLSKCHSLAAYTSQPCHTGQFPKDGRLLSLLYGEHVCILQPTISVSCICVCFKFSSLPGQMAINWDCVLGITSKNKSKDCCHCSQGVDIWFRSL